MKTSTPDYERKVLADLLEQLQHPDDTIKKQKALRRGIYGLCYTGLIIAFMTALNEMVHPFGTALLSAGSGIGIGFALFLQIAQKQWPVMTRHMDAASVENRLKELGS